MAERFYVNCELKPGPVHLQGAEAHHLAVVCRLRPGDAVCLFNGDGRQYPARIEEVGKRAARLEVLAVEEPSRELPFRLEIAAPLPRGDRAQFLLEKLTELGVAAFVPLHTARSVVHPRETKLDKLQRHVIEASKQCGRNVLLQVRPMVDWSELCKSADLPQQRLLAHPGGEKRCQEPFSRSEMVPDTVLAAVGPEGGFTDDEVALARAAGWRVLDLGPRILRVETAALALAVLLG
ncbi:MAG TPA: 16S rRNA (uracil(1498)-N(3))-methyltransferase [Gemmataceae bacterium]|jgi:16S rRNA (uracil1498-N3)-methyltransferase